MVLIGWSGFVIAFVILLAAASQNQNNIPVQSEPIIDINYNKGLYFIDAPEVKTLIVDGLQKELHSYSVKELNINKLEKDILTNPYIKSAEAYTDVQGTLRVKIVQREPIVRVINKNGVSYYLDNYGEKIPISPKFTARVPVSNGNIDDDNSDLGAVDTPVLKDLYKLAKFIHNDKYLSALVDQIYVNDQQEFEIIPKIDNHTIVLGKADNLEKKFRKLYIFYREGLKNVGWHKYSTVDLRFENQIVCKKR